MFYNRNSKLYALCLKFKIQVLLISEGPLFQSLFFVFLIQFFLFAFLHTQPITQSTLSLTGSSDKALNSNCMQNFVPHGNIKLWVWRLFYNLRQILSDNIIICLCLFKGTPAKCYLFYDKAGFSWFRIFGAVSSKF